MKTFLSILLLATTGVHAETAADIMKRFAAQEAEALEAYVKANPKAEDLATAQERLSQAYALMDDKAKQLAVLTEQYAGLAKGAAGDLRSAARNVAMRLQLLAGKKAEAKAAIAQVKKDFADHEEASQAGKFFDQLASKLDLPGEGEVMEISFTATDGTKVDLAAMKGKVVLVDFWATWCGPCVKELPNVKAAYEKHHDKGFEVIGISLDQEKSDLDAFVKKNAMPWPQAFDGKGWQNALAAKFGISSIPATFLVGKDGKIAATDLRGPALEAKVAELLK
jgi:peroxiredoxin